MEIKKVTDPAFRKYGKVVENIDFSGLIRALTGIDTDRLKEEKRRGITIELGFAWLDFPDGKRVGIVDVPGHEKFVKNMLAGAGG